VPKPPVESRFPRAASKPSVRRRKPRRHSLALGETQTAARHKRSSQFSMLTSCGNSKHNFVARSILLKAASRKGPSAVYRASQSRGVRRSAESVKACRARHGRTRAAGKRRTPWIAVPARTPRGRPATIERRDLATVAGQIAASIGARGRVTLGGGEFRGGKASHAVCRCPARDATARKRAAFPSGVPRYYGQKCQTASSVRLLQTTLGSAAITGLLCPPSNR
jgi:hypothetical protein